MAEGGRDATKIDPLNGSNYRSWKYNMKLVLMERGLWGYAQGTEDPPVTTDDDKKEKEIKEYKLKLEKAYSTIALSVSKRLQVHITDTDDPKKAWDTLEKLFNFVSVPEIVRVNRAFYAATMTEGADLNEHLTKMQELANRLRELKEDVSERKFATTILGSLPESYDVFISSLNARSADQLNWDEIKPLLIEEYTRRKEKVQQRSEDALFMQRGASSSQQHANNFPNTNDGRNQGGRRSNNNRRNYNQNFRQQQHNFQQQQIQQQQRSNPNFNNNSSNQNFPPPAMNTNFNFSQPRQMNNMNHITCFKCNRTGHKALFCPNDMEEARFCGEGRRVMNDESIFNMNESPNKRRKLNNERNGGRAIDNSTFIENDVALTSSDEGKRNDEWFLDSAASANMTFDGDNLQDYQDYNKPSNVFLGDNHYIPAIGEGKLQMTSNNDNTGKASDLVLNRVLHVPQLAKNLVSVRSIAVENNAEVVFDKDKCTVVTDDQKFVIGTSSENGKLYKLINPPVKGSTSFVNNPHVSSDHDVAAYSSCESPFDLWHRRLGHLNQRYMRNMHLRKMVDGMKVDIKSNDHISCESCVLGKMQKSSFPSESLNRASQLLELIHTDVCGPMQTDSIGGSKYFVTFTDDFSRYTTVYFMKNKSEVITKFKEYANLVENRTGCVIKKLNIWSTVKSVRSDNGGEYLSSTFQNFCAEKGISRQFTNPYTPQQNGVSERLNRTLVEAVRSMLIHSNLPLSFWAEAVQCAVYAHNRSPTSALQDVTPFECWFGVKPNISNLRVFGCVCYYHVPDSQRQKLDPKARKAIFVGYPEGVKGYKIMDIETSKFIKTRNIKFEEGTFHSFDENAVDKKWAEKFVVFPEEFISEDGDISDEKVNLQLTTDVVPSSNAVVQPVNTEIDDRDSLSAVIPDTNPVGAVQSTYEETFMQSVNEINEKRNRKPPARLVEECNIVDDNFCFAVESLMSDVDEPRTLKQALQSPNVVEWQSAMNKEYDSLLKNATWDLVPRPKGVNVVGNRWVFKVKRNMDGTISRFKARLVAQGFTQTHGVDYGEVFSPVARLQTIRSLLALGNAHNLEIHQMDVCTAFLNGDLDCEVYMEQPKGFIDSQYPDHVCKLKKGLYGLKQAARCWNSTLHEYMTSAGYRVCSADGCVYIKSERQSDGSVKFVIFPLYVDDVIPISNDTLMLEREKAALCKRFEMVDNGEISHVLGLMVKRDRAARTLTISQPTYLQEMLERFKMDGCNSVSTPLETGKQFSKFCSGDVPFDREIYQQAIGCLTYASISTRPDISSAVGALSQHMAQPNAEHWSGVKRVFRYMKGTLNYGLKFEAGDTTLHGYSDADWAGDINTRLSTSGYVFRIGNSSVSWSSKKQKTVARSSTEAEYVALSYAAQEGIWLRRLLDSLGVGSLQTEPTTIYEDNNGAIDLTKNAKHHNRTKHIDISHHFVREQVELKNISVTHCPSKYMIADIMTKGLARVQFEKLREAMGVCNVD